MPNRILREGLLTSDRIDQLDAEEERFYTRLLLVVDDYGLCDGRSSILRSWCFPLKPAIKGEQIERWLRRIAEVGLIVLYQVEGRAYVHVLETRQRTRAQRSKYPMPPELSTDHPQIEPKLSPNSACGHLSDMRPTSAHGDGDGDGGGGGGGDEKQRRARARRGPLPPLNPRPDWLPPEWDQYEQHRAGMKASWTELARTKAVEKLEGLHKQGYDIAAVINDSIASGWTGLFGKREHLRGGAGGKGSSKSRAAVEGFLRQGGQHAGT